MSSEKRPKLRDWFCGAGGAAEGYHRAGFDVVGIDCIPQKNYPFDFIQADVFTLLPALAMGLTGGLDADVLALVGDADADHASPPCQDWMLTPNPAKHGTGWMLGATRYFLERTGKPWVIENVPGADMRGDFRLCGCMFHLPNLRRERLFETSWQGFQMMNGHDHTEPAISVVGHGTPSWVRQQLGYNPSIHQYRAAMGIDWMNRNELSQAIPPAYTQFIGEQLLTHLQERAA